MKKQTGFTLIEIMIALVLGLIVLSATIGIYITTVKGSTDTINSARLNHDLESVMSLMVNDIRRAGYWGGAADGADSSTNPFTIGTANIQSPSTSCILYTYDGGSGATGGVNHDSNGLVDSDEHYGFQLTGGAIAMRLTGTTTANCADAGNTWSTLTVTESVNITALTFTAAYKCLNVSTALSYDNTCAQVATDGNLVAGQKASESRQFNIALTGQLVNDATVTKTLTGTVKIRNDRIFTQ
ncbi:MAG: PilW family protein [Methylobacter sp.]